jgi:hypothetical protein
MILAQVSHEQRSQLNAIQSASETIDQHLKNQDDIISMSNKIKNTNNII